LDNVDSLTEAFKDCYGVFAVTNYWLKMSVEVEQKQIKNIIEAAKKSKIKHCVWSTLENTTPTIEKKKLKGYTKIQNNMYIPHFDSKGSLDELFTKSGVPTTFLLTTFYWANFLAFLTPKKVKDKKNTYAFTTNMPKNSKLVGMNLDSMGAVTAKLFENTKNYVGKYVGISDEIISWNDICKKMSKATGKTIIHNVVTTEQFKKFGFPGADDMAQMFQFFSDNHKEFAEKRKMVTMKKLCPKYKFGGFQKFLDLNAKKMKFE
jgi:hypothetical protein